MRLYDGSISEFREDVTYNSLAEKLASAYKDHYRHGASKGEIGSWQQSFNFLKNSFEVAGLSDQKIIIEYELPYSSRRIDVLLFGRSTAGEEGIVLVELKQWSNDGVTDSEAEGNVKVRFAPGIKEVPHPSWQVEGYHFDLQDFLHVFQDKPAPVLSSCAYCHNYARLKEPRVLFSPKFQSGLKKFPIFTKEDVEALGKYIQDRIASGPGAEVFNRFLRSTVRPSKKLLEHTGEMINQRQIFTLIDDQIAAFNAIMHRAKRLAKSQQKAVVIVKGGPGTGKSVIALEVMGGLLRMRKTVIHATGSSAFTNTLRKIVGTRAKGLFKFFNSFIDAAENAFDVLIADEAHRIRETSNNMYTPREKKAKTPQIDELLKIARLCVFFIDEKQIVRPNEVGSIELIRDAAEKYGVKKEEIAEFELQTQFRCSGSDAYLQWLDNALGVRPSESPRFDKKMEFRIFDNPGSMMEQVRTRNSEKKNSARIAAGFCWRWSKPNPDGSLVKDVVIGDFQMPWEKKDAFWKWATDDSGMEQVGTVYTAQGFEFDYIAVIFGNDLVYDFESAAWKAMPERSHDTQVKRNNPKLLEHLASVYRVLLSRAHKGVYVYFMDKDTEKYIRSCMEPASSYPPDAQPEAEYTTNTNIYQPQILDPKPNERYVTCVPLVPLKIAAGAFGSPQQKLSEDDFDWVEVKSRHRLRPGMFVAQIAGKSMEPTIPDGSYCLFRSPVEGSRLGKTVLIQLRDVMDPETGERYTVKRYESEKNFTGDSWRHTNITLKSNNTDFQPIVLTEADEGSFQVVAELVEVLGN
jgi:uncharacterized protein